MINKRLIGMVSESKKYVAGNVALQWCSLAANIALMSAIAGLLAGLARGEGVYFGTTAVEGVDQLETYFGAYLPQFFYAMLAPLTLFLYLSFVSLPCAVVLLVYVPLIPVAIAAVQTWAKKLLSKYWGQYTALMNAKTESLSQSESRMKRKAGRSMAAANTVILLFDLAMLFAAACLYSRIGFPGVLIPTLRS